MNKTVVFFTRDNFVLFAVSIPNVPVGVPDMELAIWAYILGPDALIAVKDWRCAVMDARDFHCETDCSRTDSGYGSVNHRSQSSVSNPMWN